MTSQISGADGRGTVLVTGASGGIGRRLVERLADAGFAVYAGARSESGLKAASSISAARVVPIALDITDGESIAAAAQRLAQDLGGRGLAGLINMAGIIVEGPLELIPVANFRRQFEVNVVGPFALTRALLPLLQAGRGHIVNIGAATAHTTVPFFGAISASKAALASVSDAMRMEFGPLGVEVVLVEPGAIRTDILATSAALQSEGFREEPAERVAFYRPAIEAMRAAMRKSGADRPEVVVEAVMRALTEPRPKPRILVGKGASQLAMLRRLPTRLRDRLLMGSLGITRALRSSTAKPGRPVALRG
ncbi:SDR family NAD(P)-dependent oxidoreductase [Inquilinus limosus]|uniref:SDR family NAD(P)-dependent oxidoreductase n=1 Tax=Inquilinus limosus TaxID=171674 RepID=UPI0004046FF7|nr:SDR family NAD(P)-dependent oxidoreductase [Inquilinus limosus]